MGTRYQHLSKEERDLIAVYKAQGCSLWEIGVRIGRDKATISRELRRNAPAIYPYLRVLQFGGNLPWEKEGEAYIACPDHKNPVVFKVEIIP